MTTTPSAVPTVLGACCYCGSADPREPYVYHFDDAHGLAIRLYCSDEAACTARQNTEALWAARYALTQLGRKVVA
jgi:hypothetical protein